MAQPEQLARENIDKLLVAAGWHVCDADKTNLHAARGIAIREFPLKSGHQRAEHLRQSILAKALKPYNGDHVTRAIG